MGIDAGAEVVAQASADAGGAGVANVRFEVGDVYGLAFDDGAFDVVHVHQVLQHLTDPVRALTELRRVLKPGGLLSVRESDYGAFVWAPADPLLDRWLELYHQVTARNGADADAGRRLLGWVQRAGFSEPVAGSSTWTFATPEDRDWWSSTWAERCRSSTFAEQAVQYRLSDDAELAGMADAWRRWGGSEDGVFIVVHAEVLARR